ncbi:tubulin-like doman-containing protein [Curtobacterium sp. PhB115]|uniref:tubulin-like doman-containing protein n=1 Tax=Curtobacterium sp. PhB115 TaxID=2485173 RepID=UPI000F4B7B69|nr:tubulin-like doman-containing protein [Curtobacterium sp. PhB115]ROP64138.1 tubulin-like protein [Curtobacterium sp. PhB115]
MKKFLIVGCGGSGGATLSYLMDQLQSDLARHGIESLPAGWQFVQVDVPVAANAEAKPLPTVPDLGGQYIGTGATGVGYSVLDEGISERLRSADALGDIGTWAPRAPGEVPVAISQGAGQYRAVGRMIALSRTEDVRAGLQRAWTELYRLETNAEMTALSQRVPGLGDFSPNDPPIVLLVSSMAGGAGASMALDVARILGLLPNLEPELVGMFMVSADIFDGLPEPARSGVRSNSLAMLGEIVAAQSGAARDHDVDVLRALGQTVSTARAVPFQRVFPVGRFVGAEQTLFGDGSQQAVYRGLGRGLAALIASGTAAEQFAAYDLTNTGGLGGDRNPLGWGVSWDKLQWGSFGFASLGMGRERYREYAAQRIARSAADRLVVGHMQRGDTSSSQQQASVLLDGQWSRVLAALALPAEDGAAPTPQQVQAWFAETAFDRDASAKEAARLVDQHIANGVPRADGGDTVAAEWLGTVRGFLSRNRSLALKAVSQTAFRWAYGWQESFVRRLTDVVDEAIGTFGLAYAALLLERLDIYIENSVAPLLEQIGSRRLEIDSVPKRFADRIAAMRGRITNSSAVVDELIVEFRTQYQNVLWSESAELAGALLADARGNLVTPLRSAVLESLRLLERDREASTDGVGLARLETTVYRAWPSDDDVVVPPRFDVAHNEVLLTRASEFPAQYEADVRGAVEPEIGTSFPAARSAVVQSAVRGLWKTTGGDQAPRGLVELDIPWRSRVFSVNPETDVVEVPATARFTVHAKVEEVLDRARAFVRRPDESFDVFCRTSLKSFVRGENATEFERTERATQIATRFREALSLARPLVSVNAVGVQRIHQRQVEYRYKFSTVPFAEEGTVTETLRSVLSEDPRVDSTSVDNFANALTGAEGVTRIDIFGSYPNYSPLVFGSVLGPVAAQWGSLPAQARADWWKWRRARPLTASLPMGPEERRAMVAGWFIGQLTGEIVLPNEPYTDPVTIWDPQTSTWAPFPNPLLTPPSRFLARNDWMPAVLESLLIAIARVHEGGGFDLTPLRPYVLLRSLADASTDGGPAQGIGTTAARERIAAWVWEPRTRSGVDGVVAGVERTAVERADGALAWLDRIHAFIGENYVGPEFSGPAATGTFARVPDRGTASATPFFRDLAEDAYVVLAELRAVVQDARDHRPSPTGSGPAPVAAPNEVVVPDGGAF